MTCASAIRFWLSVLTVALALMHVFIKLHRSLVNVCRTIMYIVHCTEYVLKYIVHCTEYGLKYIYTLYRIWSQVHCTMYTVQNMVSSTLYTVQNMVSSNGVSILPLLLCVFILRDRRIFLVYLNINVPSEIKRERNE